MVKMNSFLLLLDSRNILQLIYNGLLSTKDFYLPLQWIGLLLCTRNVLGTSKIFGIPIVMISYLGGGSAQVFSCGGLQRFLDKFIGAL